MAVSTLAVSSAAMAQDNNTVEVYFSAIAEGEFIVTPTPLEVSASLSTEYKDVIGYDDTVSGPSVLDAAIAAHIAFMGEDFMDFAPLEISPQGWINNFFGLGGDILAYYQNEVPSTLDKEIEQGDYLDFDFYSDTTSWSDQYIYTDARNRDVLVGEATDISFTASTWSGNSPAAGLTVTVDGQKAGVTDSEGVFRYTFSEFGTHSISAEGTLGGAPIFMPWCEVTVTSCLNGYVAAEIENAGEYILDGINAFQLKDAVKLATMLMSDVDMSQYQKGFADSVYDHLKQNGGKIISPYSGKEDIGLYGAVILSLEKFGYSASDFKGYDIKNAFENADIETAGTHPYYYRFAIEAADEELAKKLCDDLIQKYYTKGKGLYNGVYCCDNTSYFLLAIGKYANSYQEYVDDAKAVIKSYTKENGCYNDDEGMVTEVNANSTALAMGAYAAVGDIDGAFAYYKMLLEGFEGETGIFQMDGEDDYSATVDALTALGYFKRAIEENSYEHPEHIYQTTTIPATYEKDGEEINTCLICGETATTAIPKLIKNGWFKENGKWYYYKNDTAATSWQKVKGKWYYMDKNGVMQTGWVKVKGTWYYLSASGAMVTGWKKINSKWYYFSASGAMQTGWKKINNKWYYFNASGAMQTGWKKINNKWYYFNASGAMKTGWLKDNGKWYYLDTNGAMVTGTKTINGKRYIFSKSGVMQ